MKRPVRKSKRKTDGYSRQYFLNKIIEEFLEGKTVGSLADKYNFPTRSIYREIHKRGYGDKIKSVYKDSFILSLYQQYKKEDITLDELAKQNNLCRQTLSSRFKSLDADYLKRFEKKNRKISALLANCKKRARNLNLEFDLTYEFLCEIIPKKCPCFGIDLEFGKASGMDNSPSVDRIDPKKGYTKENVWIISYRANRIKSDASLCELEQITEALKNR